MHKVLIIGLERKARQRLSAVVERFGLSAHTAATPTDAAANLKEQHYAGVMIDCGVDGASGLHALAHLPLSLDQQVVFLTDDQDQALKDAIQDADSPIFETLPREPTDADLRSACKRIKQAGAGQPKKPKRFESMLGNCPEMLEVYNVIAKVAPTEASAIICGESGTGKELVASAIHQRSNRSDRPFIAVNCGAIAENLMESELFGHEKGAFTGAEKSHAGVFEQADGGTLFLDEVTEMPLEMQVRFLRVLESGTLRRLGTEKDKRVDVRIVAATNRSPQDAVKEGIFREDLMYRLAVFPITLPPLRERGEDILLLANHFLSLHNKENGTEKRLTPNAHERLMSYNWPGNVRQLRNMVHRAYILEGAAVEMDCLDDLLEDADAGSCEDAVNTGRSESHQNDNAASTSTDSSLESGSTVTVPVGSSIEDAEKQLILKTLDEMDGNKTETAKVLGISVKTLYNRLETYTES